MFLGYLFNGDANAKTYVELVTDRAEVDLKDKARLGWNPDVFYYQVSDPDEIGLYMIKAVFYGGMSVFMTFQPEGVHPPTNFAAELFAMGIKTVVRLGDKEYVFEPREKVTDSFKRSVG